MDTEKMEQIERDIRAYRQAIRDAQDALEVAERELDEMMEAAANQGDRRKPLTVS